MNNINLPHGKGIQVWKIGSDWCIQANRISETGANWVAVKPCDGVGVFNAQYVGAFVQEMKGYGIDVWGWQYIYGKNWAGKSQAAAEANIAIKMIADLKLSGWLVDAESQFEKSGMGSIANLYMTTLRTAYPDLSIGIQSFRYPSVHPAFPWSDFMRFATFWAPQVYWVSAHNPGDQLRKSIKELTTLKSMPIIPTGAAYAEGTWTGPTVGELNEFNSTAKALDLPGLIWWAWDDNGPSTHPDWLASITAHDWGHFEDAPSLSYEQKVDMMWQWAINQGMDPRGKNA